MRDGVARRELLKAIGGGFAMGALAPAFLGTTGCRGASALPDAIAQCVDATDAARVVGEAFLLPFGPKRPSAEALCFEMAGEEREAWERMAAEGGTALCEAIRARHRADLDAGRMHAVRGWLLSETEARLSGVVASRGA